VCFDEKQIYRFFTFFEEPTVAGDTCLAMMENIAVRHNPVGTVRQLDDPLYHFSSSIRAFLAKEFHDRWMGRRGPKSYWCLHHHHSFFSKLHTCFRIQPDTVL
jgi:hypothetical protein